MAYASLHLWGDSLGKGVVFDEERKRYCITPERCVVGLEKALGVPVVNHSRMGATACEGFLDFAQSEPEDGALIVIEYGGNDCDMPWADIAENPDADYQARVPLLKFTDALRQFVGAVRAKGLTPMLVTPPPLEAQRYFTWVTRGICGERVLRFLGDVQHIYRWQERYANAVRDVAAHTKTVLFDMRDAFLVQRHYPSLMCLDGIHLTAEGQRMVTESVIAQRGALKSALAATQAMA